MTNLLDALKQLIVDGEGEHVVFTELDTLECLHPNVAGDTGYKYGCRCRRCRDHHSKVTSSYGRKARAERTIPRSWGMRRSP